jgi:apolipoprotein N-acyltransferase
VSFVVQPESPALPVMAEAAPPGGYLLAGAPRAGAQIEDGVWNSLLAIDSAGHLRASYDKVHLVPFGEYVPLRSILPLPKITAGSIDLSSGPGPRTLDLPGLPAVGPSICYEDIFPEGVMDSSRRPGWLLNVTNDAWFGFSSGPFQHFAMARVRSVEQGLPLVRSANNGISGVVDPYGRIVKRLALDDVGVLDAELPTALSKNTVYGSIGDWILLLLLAMCAAPLLRYSRVRQDH